MDFRQHQEAAARDSRRLAFLYALAVLTVVGVFHFSCVLIWSLIYGSAPLPYGFLAINLLATAGLILGGSLLEFERLDSCPSTVADRLGARQLEPGSARLDRSERRLLNLVEEMALAAHQPVPRLYLLDRDLSINALTTGMRQEDAIVIVTRGAIERLGRDELQGVVAHEMAHLASGDVAITTRTMALTSGLEMVHDAGRRAVNLGFVYLVPGYLLLACGWLGHLAGLILASAMSRSREWHADAEAVRLTRLASGLGNALRKAQWLASQPEAAAAGVLGGPEAALYRPAMFQLPGRSPAWFATHPPLAERVARLLGRNRPPLPCPLIERPTPFAAPSGADAGGAPVTSPAPSQEPSPEPSPEGRPAGGTAGAAVAALAGTSTLVGAGPGTAAARDSADGAGEAGEAGEADWLMGRGLPALDYAPVLPVAPDLSARLVVLAKAAHEPTRAAALSALLILGAGVETELWPARWRAAASLQEGLAAELKAIGPDRVETLRWPLLELASATLRPLARPWREDLLWMLRSQIDLDQRVTLAEWIYYLILRVRVMPLSEAAWPGDESPADPAAAVRWVIQLLARVSRQPELRAERLTNEVIRRAHLSRTGQDHPPFDVGGLQASVGALRRLPGLQRPLLMRDLAAFLPGDAPVEARDFLRVLAVIIDTPLPHFPSALAAEAAPVGAAC